MSRPSVVRSSTAGYRAFKTNIVVPGDEPRVLMPGFGRDGGTDRNPTPELIPATLRRLLDAFCEGSAGGAASPIVDLNFNLTVEGIVEVARALEPYGLAWLEVDAFDPRAPSPTPARCSPIPICSGENLYTLRGFRPYLEAGAMDIASVDVIWTGFAQSRARSRILPRRTRLPAPRTTTTVTLPRSSPRSGAPRSRTCACSRSTSTTSPGGRHSRRRYPRLRMANW